MKEKKAKNLPELINTEKVYNLKSHIRTKYFFQCNDMNEITYFCNSIEWILIRMCFVCFVLFLSSFQTMGRLLAKLNVNPFSLMFGPLQQCVTRFMFVHFIYLEKSRLVESFNLCSNFLHFCCCCCLLSFAFRLSLV